MAADGGLPIEERLALWAGRTLARSGAVDAAMLRPPRPGCRPCWVAVALCLGIYLASASSPTRGAEAPCEVCQDFLKRFYSSLKEKHSDFSVASIENELVRSCMNTKGKEDRLCYYIGATSDAATKIIGEVSRPMSAHIPVPKICEKLKKIDIQICELKYEMELDLTAVDLSKMKVAELRKILDRWGEVCRACIEKKDFVDLIRALAPKHTAASSRAEL